MATIERKLGVSQAAQTVNQFVSELYQYNNKTVTFSNHSLVDQLIDAFSEASEPGWDGEGSIAVELETLQVTRKLVESLPTAYRTPEISAEPDGQVDLTWRFNSRRILSVSVAPNGLLHWAALIGQEDPRGTCRFEGQTPATLLYLLGRVCGQ